MGLMQGREYGHALGSFWSRSAGCKMVGVHYFSAKVAWCIGKSALAICWQYLFFFFVNSSLGRFLYVLWVFWVCLLFIIHFIVNACNYLANYSAAFFVLFIARVVVVYDFNLPRCTNLGPSLGCCILCGTEPRWAAFPQRVHL